MNTNDEIEKVAQELYDAVYGDCKSWGSINRFDKSAYETAAKWYLAKVESLQSQNLRMRQALERITKEFPTIKIGRLSGVTDDLHETIEEALNPKP